MVEFSCGQSGGGLGQNEAIIAKALTTLGSFGFRRGEPNSLPSLRSVAQTVSRPLPGSTSSPRRFIQPQATPRLAASQQTVTPHCKLIMYSQSLRKIWQSAGN